MTKVTQFGSHENERSFEDGKVDSFYKNTVLQYQRVQINIFIMCNIIHTHTVKPEILHTAGKC